MAVPTYSDIVDLLKKGATVEAQEKIMALREETLRLQEENLELKSQIRTLIEQLATNAKLTFDGQVYWLDDEGEKDGPYCQRCYDVETLLVRLQRRSIDDIDHENMRTIKNAHYYFHCLKCDSNYEPPRA